MNYRPLQFLTNFENLIFEEYSIFKTFEGNLPNNWKKKIEQGIRKFQSLGIGGLVVNVAFKNYLEDCKSWEILEYGVKKSLKAGLIIWLYDEKGYPSGTAGGKVLKHTPSFEACGLTFQLRKGHYGETIRIAKPHPKATFIESRAYRIKNGKVTLGNNKNLKVFVNNYGRLLWSVPKGDWAVTYFASQPMYEATHADNNTYAKRRYINVLDEKAVAMFIELTHKKYWQKLGEYFGRGIEAIFTDEPSFLTYHHPLLFSKKYKKGVIIEDTPGKIKLLPAVPWREDLFAIFKKKKGYALQSHLGSLFMDFGPERKQVQQIRIDFYDVISHLYSRSYFNQIENWCHKHNIISTGHVLHEEGLPQNIAAEGNLLKILKEMGIPGVDTLNSDPRNLFEQGNFVAPKITSSAAHLCGKKFAMSEVSDWIQRGKGKRASLNEMLGTINSLYALGINRIISCYPWNEFDPKEYRTYNDYIGLLGRILSKGKRACDIGLIYPIRNAWGYYHPSTKPLLDTFAHRKNSINKNKGNLQLLNKSFIEISEILLRNQFDFDYLEEEDICKGEIKKRFLQIGGCASYRVIIIPDMEFITYDTFLKLQEFVKNGGIALAVNKTPETEGNKSKDFFCMVSQDMLDDYLNKHFPPFLILNPPNKNILCLHKKMPGDLYFLANISPRPQIMRELLFNDFNEKKYKTYSPKKDLTSSGTTSVNFEPFEGIFIFDNSI